MKRLRETLLAARNQPAPRASLRERAAELVTTAAIAVLLYGVLTPAGWLLRRTGRDALRIRRPRDPATYWIEREPPGPSPQSMLDEF